MAAFLALCSSLLWGTGDFLGGRASRHWSVLQILAASQLATLLLIWAAVGVGHVAYDVDISIDALILGAAGGCAGIIGLAAFYRALAIGPMAVVPPIAAAGVVIPVIVGLATGSPPTVAVVVGICIAVIGVVLASIGSSAPIPDGGTTPTRIAASTLGLCVISACGFALIFVALDAAAGSTAGSALVATAGVRIGSFVTVLVALAVTSTRPFDGVPGLTMVQFAGIGILDTGANLLFAIAAAFGDLAVVAVLGSLYPAVTSSLAHVVLGERLGRLQLLGVVCALGGVALLATR